MRLINKEEQAQIAILMAQHEAKEKKEKEETKELLKMADDRSFNIIRNTRNSYDQAILKLSSIGLILSYIPLHIDNGDYKGIGYFWIGAICLILSSLLVVISFVVCIIHSYILNKHHEKVRSSLPLPLPNEEIIYGGMIIHDMITFFLTVFSILFCFGGIILITYSVYLNNH